MQITKFAFLTKGSKGYIYALLYSETRCSGLGLVTVEI